MQKQNCIHLRLIKIMVQYTKQELPALQPIEIQCEVPEVLTYNIVLIIGCCSVVSPLTGDGKNSFTAMIIMNAVALLLFLFMLPGKKLYRWQGFVFLAVYAAFIAWTFCGK